MSRSNVITFKASSKERAILETIAAKEDRTVSEMLRELIREGAANRGVFSIGGVKLFSKFELKSGGKNDETSG